MPGDLTITNSANSLGLTTDWLGDTATATNRVTYWGDWTYPIHYCNHGYFCTCRVETKKIKLTLSEVEKLRAAAKRTPALKAILSKFTDIIEIEVDFP